MTTESKDLLFVTVGVTVLLICVGGGVFSFSTRTSQMADDQAAAIEWAKQVPAYTLIDTHMFNGREWKTYRQNSTGKLFLLSPMGMWLEVED